MKTLFTIPATAIASSLFILSANADDYYFQGAYDSLISATSTWSTDPSGIGADYYPTTAPNETTVLNIERNSMLYGDKVTDYNHARLSTCSDSEAGTVNHSFAALNATVRQEFKIGNYKSAKIYINILGDYTSSLTGSKSSLYGYDTSQNLAGKADLRFAVLSQNDNFLKISGNWTLNTTQYNNIVLYRENNTKTSISVGGVLSLNWDGLPGDKGFHLFNTNSRYISPTSSEFTVDLNLGGLKTTGKVAAFTAYEKTLNNFIFTNATSGSFSGGDFEGVLLKEKEHDVKNAFYMRDSSGSGKVQSIKIYKASNFEKHGIEEIVKGTDAKITRVEVENGNMEFYSELAVEYVNIKGGSLKFSSTEKVGKLEFNSKAGSDLIFDGTITAGSFDVNVSSVDIIFGDEFIDENELTIVKFDSSNLATSSTFDSIEFNAFDTNGVKLDGLFAIVDNALVYSAAVPEPATIAAIFGAIALAFVAYRRRK